MVPASSAAPVRKTMGMSRSRVRLHQARGGEAVEARHVDVQDQDEAPLRQPRQRLLAGRRRDHLVAERGQDSSSMRTLAR
ncbi:MAG: hypothetical protein WKG00_11240 [Polyangiaceae bacterium]